MNRIKWFDAVRAFGLLLVLCYHLFYNILPGGFLGVDIFLTFSGFLITALIMEEVRKRSSFALFRFYKRRFQRIFIPLALCIIFTLPLALLISPDFTVGVGKNIAAALSFTTNLHEIFVGSSYEHQMIPSLYIHTWSLALEMQFYLSWGLICALLSLFSRAVFQDDKARHYNLFRGLVLVVAGVIAASSYVYMQHLYNNNASLDAIYFNSFARFFPFFIGSFAAAIWGVQETLDEEIRSQFFPKNTRFVTAGLIVITLLVAGIFIFNLSQHKFEDDFVYHNGFLFSSILTVVLIYCTHALHIVTPKDVKEPRLLKATADLSYDVYLFHWPLYIILSAIIVNNLAASFATLVASFAFSALMVYYAEKIFISNGHTVVCPSRTDKVACDINNPGCAECIGALRRRRQVTAVTVTAGIVAIGLCALVLYRAPEITSIEEDFAVSYTLADTSRVINLGDSIVSLNATPEPDDGQDNTDKMGEQGEIGDVSSDGGTSSTEPDPEQTLEPEPMPDGSQGETLPMPAAPPADISEITGSVTVIGDSVSLGAQSALENAMNDVYVDSEVSRPVSAGIGILKDLQSRGKLREYVVIALGTNGTNSYEKLFTEIIDELEAGHRLIFVTPFDGRSNENSKATTATAEWMRTLPSQYDFITIADWADLISSQVDTLAGDKVHMGGKTSMALYAGCVADAVVAAAAKPAK